MGPDNPKVGSVGECEGEDGWAGPSARCSEFTKDNSQARKGREQTP